MTERDGAFSRWSRRKLASRSTAAEKAGAQETPGTAEIVPEASVDAGTAARPGEPLSDTEHLERHGLPDPETLQAGDDVAAFMKADIPDALKRRALRRLWVNNPALANLDGLVEYGEDYTNSAVVPAVINTLYKVGRGLRENAPPTAEIGSGEGAKPATIAGEADSLEQVSLPDEPASREQGDPVPGEETAGVAKTTAGGAHGAATSSVGVTSTDGREAEGDAAPAQTGVIGDSVRSAATDDPQRPSVRPRRMRFAVPGHSG